MCVCVEPQFPILCIDFKTDHVMVFASRLQTQKASSSVKTAFNINAACLFQMCIFINSTVSEADVIIFL